MKLNYQLVMNVSCMYKAGTVQDTSRQHVSRHFKRCISLITCVLMCTATKWTQYPGSCVFDHNLTKRAKGTLTCILYSVHACLVHASVCMCACTVVVFCLVHVSVCMCACTVVVFWTCWPLCLLDFLSACVLYLVFYFCIHIHVCIYLCMFCVFVCFVFMEIGLY